MPTSKRSYKSNIKQVMIIVNLISQKQVVSGLKKKAYLRAQSIII